MYRIVPRKPRRMRWRAGSVSLFRTLGRLIASISGDSVGSIADNRSATDDEGFPASKPALSTVSPERRGPGRSGVLGAVDLEVTIGRCRMNRTTSPYRRFTFGRETISVIRRKSRVTSPKCRESSFRGTLSFMRQGSRTTSSPFPRVRVRDRTGESYLLMALRQIPQGQSRTRRR